MTRRQSGWRLRPRNAVLADFDTGFAAIAGRFGRVEPRRQARSFLLGLLSDVDTRSCWQLAEQAGDASPHAMQSRRVTGGRLRRMRLGAGRPRPDR
jgi:hypothetical protein